MGAKITDDSRLTHTNSVSQDDILEALLESISQRHKCSPGMIAVDVPLRKLGLSGCRGLIGELANRFDWRDFHANGLNCNMTAEQLAEAIWQKIL